MTAGISHNTRHALANSCAEEAIEWMVLFRSGEATPEDYQRFSAWNAADPGNAQAWERMQGVLQRSFTPVREADSRTPGQVQAVERVVLRTAATASRRKVLGGTLAFAAAGVASGLLVHRALPLTALRADFYTATAQRKQVTLPDGSTLMLNARTAADIDFSHGLRRIRLYQGEVMATVAADAARPFVIETSHGTARALGTRFLVRREEEQTLALVLEHSILVSNGSARQVLQQGQAAYLDASGVTRLNGDTSGLAAWVNGMLVANDEPLMNVIAALRPYRKGFIRLSPTAARLRVLGAFPLDDTDNVLRSLEQTMPVSVRNFGNLLVMIDVR